MTDWESAVCRQFDPEMWFPTVPNIHHVPAALCDTCPIRQECLTGALRVEAAQTYDGPESMLKYIYGIYGGYTPRQRIPYILRVKAGEKAADVADEALTLRDYRLSRS